MAAEADGPRHFERRRGLSGAGEPVDLAASARTLGLPPDLRPSTPVRGTPLRHRGAHAGRFPLAGSASSTSGPSA